MDTPDRWGSGKHNPLDLFDFGTVHWSKKALVFLKTLCGDEDPKAFSVSFVLRHVQGDAGDAPMSDTNEKAIQTGEGVVLSSYRFEATHLVVITDFASERTIVGVSGDMLKSNRRGDGWVDLEIDLEDE